MIDGSSLRASEILPLVMGKMLPNQTIRYVSSIYVLYRECIKVYIPEAGVAWQGFLSAYGTIGFEFFRSYMSRRIHKHLATELLKGFAGIKDDVFEMYTQGKSLYIVYF